MAKSGITGGKTNKHKSTMKAHTRSQLATAAPKTRGKPRTTAAAKPRSR